MPVSLFSCCFRPQPSYKEIGKESWKDRMLSRICCCGPSQSDTWPEAQVPNRPHKVTSQTPLGTGRMSSYGGTSSRPTSPDSNSQDPLNLSTEKLVKNARVLPAGDASFLRSVSSESGVGSLVDVNGQGPENAVQVEQPDNTSLVWDGSADPRELQDNGDNASAVPNEAEEALSRTLTETANNIQNIVDHPSV